MSIKVLTFRSQSDQQLAPGKSTRERVAGIIERIRNIRKWWVKEPQREEKAYETAAIIRTPDEELQTHGRTENSGKYERARFESVQECNNVLGDTNSSQGALFDALIALRRMAERNYEEILSSGTISLILEAHWNEKNREYVKHAAGMAFGAITNATMPNAAGESLGEKPKNRPADLERFAQWSTVCEENIGIRVCAVNSVAKCWEKTRQMKEAQMKVMDISLFDENEKVREAAALAVGNLIKSGWKPEEWALGKLIFLYNEKKAAVRKAAGSALLEAMHYEGMRERVLDAFANGLFHAVRGGNRSEVMELSLAGIEKALELGCEAPKTVVPLVFAISAKGGENRKKAIGVLQMAGAATSISLAIDDLSALLHEKDGEVVRSAALALEQIAAWDRNNSKRAVSVLGSALLGCKKENVMILLDSLENIRDAEVSLEPVHSALKRFYIESQDIGVKAFAALLAGKKKSKDEMRKKAGKALMELGNKYYETGFRGVALLLSLAKKGWLEQETAAKLSEMLKGNQEQKLNALIVLPAVVKKNGVPKGLAGNAASLLLDEDETIRLKAAKLLLSALRAGAEFSEVKGQLANAMADQKHMLEKDGRTIAETMRIVEFGMKQENASDKGAAAELLGKALGSENSSIRRKGANMLEKYLEEEAVVEACAEGVRAALHGEIDGCRFVASKMVLRVAEKGADIFRLLGENRSHGVAAAKSILKGRNAQARLSMIRAIAMARARDMKDDDLLGLL
ncbi:MAG: hypothetical protein PHS02_03980, partial [Candidatus ainarchaeum sp.]|nr:hypothetical protein [Candidatus ainarchaeum sp.]